VATAHIDQISAIAPERSCFTRETCPVPRDCAEQVDPDDYSGSSTRKKIVLLMWRE
jgi:hypothetical protein